MLLPVQAEKSHASTAGDYPPANVPPYVRRQFRARVFALLAVQLACTAGGVAAMRASEGTRDAVRAATPWLVPLSFAGSMACSCAIQCAESARGGLALLFAFTACETALLGALTLPVAQLPLLAAAACSVGLFAALAAVADRIDVVGWTGWLLAGTAGLLVGGVVEVLLPSAALHGWLVAGGVALFGAWVVYDVSTMRHMGPDDAIVATLNLYMDVIGLFVYVLQCLQGSASKE